ncbi:hypothetical protein LZF95_21085 [Algoriphagus sp. AGSA1]|uniref:hypothetical protein n=1 Tax=Algoriphagus sp. AGSA1 TaxID=2907213 RepID=UPI001F1A42C8|nr:hypothetical protein [Algoriphagus sp. AGSA1]MCE7057189.1 hypothetical protein [Algoriphagus sp. AGSA1]
MKVKEIWTELDFEDMGWHDCHIHAISFPNEELEMSFDIDYLFKWELDDKSNLYKFWVSPCILFFYNVINLKIDIDFQNAIGLDILDINKKNLRLSADKKTNLWDFEIATDKGLIKFESSGYKQVVKNEPICSESQILARKNW